MATDFMTTTSAFHQQHPQHFYPSNPHYYPNQHPPFRQAQSQLTSPTFHNPPTSPTRSHSIQATDTSTYPPNQQTSPTSLPAIRQQTRSKAPFYVPAALRPTEAPSRQRQPPHPQHQQPSQNSQDLSSSASPIPPSTQRSSRTSTYVASNTPPEVSRLVGDEWNSAPTGKVTGPPTRNHWKPDFSTDTCASPACARPFTFLIRRHHCRRCGNIFCASHSPYSVPLDQHARFHSHGSPQRACDPCWSDYRTWKGARASSSSSAMSSMSSPLAGNSIAKIGSSDASPLSSVAAGSSRGGSVGGSVGSNVGVRTATVGAMSSVHTTMPTPRISVDGGVFDVDGTEDSNRKEGGGSGLPSSGLGLENAQLPATVTEPANHLKTPVGNGIVGLKTGSYVGSVPRDWNWSTF